MDVILNPSIWMEAAKCGAWLAAINVALSYIVPTVLQSLNMADSQLGTYANVALSNVTGSSIYAFILGVLYDVIRAAAGAY